MQEPEQFAHEAKRLVRFEPAEVTKLNSDRTVDTETAGRAHERTKTSRASGVKLREGDRTILLSSGDNDQPIVIGQNPWVTG